MWCDVITESHPITESSDAIWLKDPKAEIFDTLANDTDIIASRASFPFELGRKGGKPGKWGATCCMGFVLFKATLPAQRFVMLANHLLRSAKEKVKDDQTWINFALSELEVEWPELEKGEKLKEHGTEVNTTTGQVPVLGLKVCTRDIYVCFVILYLSS